MDNKMFKKSLMKTISMMADIDDYYDEKEERLQAMMRTYLAISL